MDPRRSGTQGWPFAGELRGTQRNSVDIAGTSFIPMPALQAPVLKVPAPLHNATFGRLLQPGAVAERSTLQKVQHTQQDFESQGSEALASLLQAITGMDLAAYPSHAPSPPARRGGSIDLGLMGHPIRPASSHIHSGFLDSFDQMLIGTTGADLQSSPLSSMNGYNVLLNSSTSQLWMDSQDHFDANAMAADIGRMPSRMFADGNMVGMALPESSEGELRSAGLPTSLSTVPASIQGTKDRMAMQQQQQQQQQQQEAQSEHYFGQLMNYAAHMLQVRHNSGDGAAASAAGGNGAGIEQLAASHFAAPGTASAGGPGHMASKSKPQIKHWLYKTEMCRNWVAQGSCPYGVKCQFAHGAQDLRDRSGKK